MMLLDGIHVPLSAPFYRDGKLYLRKLEHNVRRYSLTPASALVAFDPRMEASALSDAEIADSLVAIAETAAPEKVLVACVRRDSVAQALAFAEQASATKFDALAVAAPPCWPSLLQRSGDLELLNFFRTVADNSPLPVVLWSDPTAPTLGLSVDIVGALSTHPNIIGIYDADIAESRFAEIKRVTAGVQHDAIVTPVFRPVTRRMLEPVVTELVGAGSFVSAELLSAGSGTSAIMPSAPTLKTRTKMLGFQILSAGPASAMPALLRAGAAGMASALACAAPQAVHEAFAAHTDNNPALAEEKAMHLVEADDLFRDLGPAAVKYAADLTGYFGGAPRLPLLPLNAAQRERVDAVFRLLRN